MSTNLVTAATPPVGAGELQLLNWHGCGFEVRMGVTWLVLFALIGAIAGWGVPWARRKWMRGFRTKGVKLSFRGVEWEICPDSETRRIAHQAWVEIKSRKVGLPFEAQSDVIVEIYNSWHQVFGVLRELAKSIPADKLQDCEDTQNLVALLMKALNEGLRPHLTTWQAKFRRWYEGQLREKHNDARSPQEIQSHYPQYDELVMDLRRVNQEFVTFANSLEQLVKTQTRLVRRKAPRIVE